MCLLMWGGDMICSIILHRSKERRLMAVQDENAAVIVGDGWVLLGHMSYI